MYLSIYKLQDLFKFFKIKTDTGDINYDASNLKMEKCQILVFSTRKSHFGALFCLVFDVKV